MMNQNNTNLSEFMTYLASIPETSSQKIPPLNLLSRELGISVATLREQLEEARSLGIVEVKPKAGIRKLPYDFSTALKPGLTYAVHEGCISYQQFADLRKHLETAYFVEAAQSLDWTAIEKLEELVNEAFEIIQHTPGKVPAAQHREFHTLIYKHLNNQYLNGVLDAYWEVYHLSGLEVYPDISYIERVWQYHSRIVDQLQKKNFSEGLTLLVEHMDLLNQREKHIPRLSFE
jgi:DNA-binding FadR family transcriptional regulator